MTNPYRKKQIDTAQSAAPAVDPSAITQSYYTSPTNATNYETGRPIYQQSQAIKDAANAVVQVEQNKPSAFDSRYDAQIQRIMDEVLGREDFAYDPAADPLYRHYADQYQRKGQLAMRDAMAQSAALTGGYGNSYAMQAGQQGYQRYLEEMNQVIPQLQEAAYRMYQDAGDTLRTNLDMLKTADDTDYGRYRDTVGDWQDELNYYSDKLSTMSDREYERFVNDAKAWENDRKYWADKAQDEREYQLALSKQSGGGSRSGGSGASQPLANVPSIAEQIAAGIAQTQTGLLDYLRNRTNRPGGALSPLQLKA